MAAPALPAPAGLPAATRDLVLAQIALDGDERSAAKARALVANALGKTNPQTPTACLLVSELVTNALLHSRSARPGGAITVTLCDVAPGFRIEVTDDGSPDSVPVLKTNAVDTNGRGLLLVNALADAWGYRRMVASTTVWFRLDS